MVKAKVVVGKPNWDKQFGELAVLSAPEFFPALLGPKAENVLAHNYHTPDGIFQRAHSMFVQVDNKPVGLGTVYTYEQEHGTFLPMVRYFLASMGPITLAAHGPVILTADKKMAKLKPNQAYLCNYAVYREHRNKGYGSLIMDHAMTKARKNGSDAMLLDVETWNKDAQRLYKSFGFKKRERYRIRTKKKTFEFFGMVCDLNR